MAQPELSLISRFYQKIINTVGIQPPDEKPFVLSTGERPPNFYNGTYLNAVSEAKARFKFLLIYLHSPCHADSPKFLRDTLCTPHVASFLEDNFVLWGGDVQTSEDAFKLSASLNASTFPFFAVLANFEGSLAMNHYLSVMGNAANKMRSGAVVIHRIQGLIGTDDLLQLLTGILEDFGPLLVVSQKEMEERQTSRTLVDLQNEAFEETLRQDREKEERRRAEEQRRIDEERERLEAERLRQEAIRQAQEQAEREQQRLLEEKKKVEERKAYYLSNLAPEPDKGPDVVTVCIRLYNGTKLNRRFNVNDNMKVLFDFVASKEDLDKYVVGTHYPKFQFTDMNITIKDAKLTNGTTLFVDLPE